MSENEKPKKPLEEAQVPPERTNASVKAQIPPARTDAVANLVVPSPTSASVSSEIPLQQVPPERTPSIQPSSSQEQVPQSSQTSSASQSEE